MCRDDDDRRSVPNVWPIVFILVLLGAGPVNRSFCLAQGPPGEPLQQLINRHFQNDLPRGSLASDSEFARRVSIDLTGMPLDVEAFRKFLADPDPAKREKLVDRLLASPQFERRLLLFLDLTLMERRPYRDISEPQWIAYLLESVRQNKPWNILAREILSADGTDEKLRPAVRFALDRGGEPNLLTRDIGRVFFGRDLQCAQCHNHPLVDDYLQSDYQGLLAFVAPGYIKTIQKPGPKTKDGKPGKPVSLKVYAEKDGNDIGFESVFVKNTKHRTGPRLIGEQSIVEPDRLPATESGDQPVHSRRKVLAVQATDGTNRAFNENIANRMWAMMMGRGLVDPPDFHHRDNPPVKPELLQALGEKMVELQFDMKAFLQGIALSEPYQRAYALPSEFSAENALSQRLVELKQQKDRISKLLEDVRKKYDAADTAFLNSESAYIPVALEVEKLRGAMVASSAAMAKLKTAVEKNQAQAKQQQDVAALVADSTNRISGVARNLKEPAVTAIAQRLQKKLAVLEGAAQKQETTLAASQKQLAESKKKLESAKSAVLAGYAKKQPLRANLAGKEKNFREFRTRVEELVESRNAIESEIQTCELLAKFVRLRQKLVPQDARLPTADATTRSENGTPDKQSAVKEMDPDKLKQELARVEESLSNRLTRNNVVSSLRPLTPEQLALSTLGVTGVYSRYQAIEEKKLRKEKSLGDDEVLSLDDQRLVEERTWNVLKSHIANFVRYYAAGAGQPQGDFFATADQALFATNAGLINSYVNPAGGNVTDRMIKSKDDREAARDLYLTILSRQPSNDEVDEVVSYLQRKKDKRADAVRELAWGLLNSAEFRFNH